MATVHLLAGSTGAGKTTFAIQLARDTGAIRFSIDDWMAELFIPDAPTHTFAWAIERIGRCERRIWSVAQDVLARDVDVILDLGFSKREHRDRFRAIAAEAGYESKLYFLDAPADVRRARVRARNTAASGTFSFEVNESMFDWMEAIFEAPVGEELAGAEVVTTGD